MISGTTKYSTNQWPANLFHAFNKYLMHNYLKGRNFDPSELSQDQIKGLEYILDNINTKETMILTALYKQKLPVDEIITQFHVSYAKVISIKNKAFSRMAEEPYLSYMLYGIKTTTTNDIVNKRSAKKRYIKIICTNTNKTESEIKNFLDTDILTIDVHKRTTNAFRRYGIKTVYDLIWLLQTAPRTTLLIHSIGEGGLQNIIDWLTQQTGLTFQNPFAIKKKGNK